MKNLTKKTWRMTVSIILISFYLTNCIDDPRPISEPTSEIISVEFTNNQLLVNAEILNSGNEKLNEIGIIISKDIDPAGYSISGDFGVFIPVGNKNSYQIPLDLSEPGYYFMRSILKTQGSGWLYSPLYEFDFDGSSINNTSEISFTKDGIYYGDTITISNVDFGISPSNYYAEVNGVSAKITNASLTSFQLIIPDSLDFFFEEAFEHKSKINSPHTFISISYMTSNGIVSKIKKVNFIAPSFESFENIEKDLPPGKNWIIHGVFLNDPYLTVKVANTESLLKIVKISETEIELEPGQGIDFNDPTLIVVCRGEEYTVNFSEADWWI